MATGIRTLRFWRGDVIYRGDRARRNVRLGIAPSDRCLTRPGFQRNVRTIVPAITLTLMVRHAIIRLTMHARLTGKPVRVCIYGARRHSARDRRIVPRAASEGGLPSQRATLV